MSVEPSMRLRPVAAPDLDTFFEHQRDPVALRGYVGSFVRNGLREVAYWYGREHWGKGIATAALRAFLRELPERPLHARVTVDHTASRRVLEKVGFRIAARESVGEGAGDEVEE